MMKVLEIIKWEGNQLAVAFCYADSSSDLATKTGSLTLSKGSMCMLANGKVYVLGNTWNEVGA